MTAEGIEKLPVTSVKKQMPSFELAIRSCCVPMRSRCTALFGARCTVSMMRIFRPGAFVILGRNFLET